ncbi:MAG: hypothetical protein PF517_12945 [Salinivirgaceae bacterium]|jgi:hypothetical protein|nr:hypothetical protein [Salinivirgaceae bacterium]
MKLKININEIKTVNEFDFYWKTEDYINLLKEFDFLDAEKSNKAELLDLLLMAITDFEPNEAAQILLTYKLSKELNEGQIHSLSHEMINDKVAEEYPEPTLHFALFNINQLLHRAYNGIFPNTEASIIDMEISPITDSDGDGEINKEILIKALGAGLKDNNLIKRLFEQQICGNELFSDAAKTIWKIIKIKDNNYLLITSKYWLDKEDFLNFKYDTEIVFFEEL